MAEQPMFQNPQKITEIDLGWQKADYVSPSAEYNNDDKDADPTALAFAWFRVNSDIKPSQKEEDERVAAIRVQFEQKVINKYGMPYGSPMPPEVKEMVKEMEEKKKGGINGIVSARELLINRLKRIWLLNVRRNKKLPSRTPILEDQHSLILSLQH